MLNETRDWWTTTVIDGNLVAYEVTVNTRRMDQLAAKALRNKSKRTKVGPLDLRIIKNITPKED